MWPTPRDLWWLDDATVHLNHGSFGAVPCEVFAAQEYWRLAMERNPTDFFWRVLPERMDHVRQELAEFVGADPSRFVLMPNVTTAVAAILTSVHLSSGDEVLITDDVYPGVRAAVEQTCRQFEAAMVVAQLPPDDMTSGAYARALLQRVTKRTRLAIIEHITPLTAIHVDVSSLCTELHAAGVFVAIDGAHAPGAIDLDLRAISADYYAGNFHKWCCAARGSGFVEYGENAPPLSAAVVGSRAEEGLPSGLEWWGTTDYSALLATPSALTFLGRFGWQQVRDGNARLAIEGAKIVAAALGVPGPVESDVPMAIVTLPERLRHLDTGVLRSILLDRRIEVTVAKARGIPLLRLSAHLYNSDSDYERLALALQEIKAGEGPE